MRLPKPDFSRLNAALKKLPFAMPRLGRLRLSQSLIALLAFAGAGGLAVLVAWGSAVVIEKRSAAAVKSRFIAEDITWVNIQPDGLLIHLRGTAPNEAARFRAVNLTGAVIDSSRIRDHMGVAPEKGFEAPRFSIEILRNDDGIQLIGLLPDDGTEATLSAAAKRLSNGADVSDMLETAAYRASAKWKEAFEFGVSALELLPRSKISVSADGVQITAIASSETEKRRLESDLASRRPKGLPVSLSISAPRPVLTPFTLRFVLDGDGARFDACSADTEAARDKIIAAATAAGAVGKQTCTVGLGVPTPRWGAAAVAGINAIAALGAGTITFSDADVTLLASEDTTQATFDRVVGELQTALPEVFSLDAKLPKKADAAPTGPAEFTARLGDDGKVELRGLLTDERQRDVVDSFAKAEFGVGNVYIATRLDTELPDGWPVRVLAGIEALGELEKGDLTVRPDIVEVSGITGSQDARARISQILSGKLGQGKTFKVSVVYDEKLDPLAALPTPEECLGRVNEIVAKQKIQFQPGSAEIDGTTAPLMTAMAEALADCPGLPMEIAGYTDAQGSEGGNKALSQARAEAVLIALEGRRVDVSEMKAVGYGEENPVADNSTDEGREANRRIEFTLIGAPMPAPKVSFGTGLPAGPEDAAQATDPTEAPKTTGTTIAARAVPDSAAACVGDIATLLAKQKITFDPGSDKIGKDSAGLIAALTTLLQQCPGVPIEIAGHTDSQGSERGNKTLSENRAKAVLTALQERGLDVSKMKAVGYGESTPIADNATEAGREANRRIEFTLIGATAANDGAAAPTPTGTEPSVDSAPSVAPTEKTLLPKARPDKNG
jgi:OmpA-OmpF porin, OOP family